MRQYISIVVKCRRMIQTNKQMRIYRVRSVNDRQDGRRKKKKNRTKYGTERSDAMKSRWIAFGVCNLRNLFDLVVSHSNRQTIFFLLLPFIIVATGFLCAFLSIFVPTSFPSIQVDLVSYFLMRMQCNNEELLEEMNWHHVICYRVHIIVNGVYLLSIEHFERCRRRRTCCIGVSVGVAVLFWYFCFFSLLICCCIKKGYNVPHCKITKHTLS